MIQDNSWLTNRGAVYNCRMPKLETLTSGNLAKEKAYKRKKHL